MTKRVPLERLREISMARRPKKLVELPDLGRPEETANP